MIHETTVIQGDVTVHHSAVVGPFCVLGSSHGRLEIPPGCVIRSHSIIEGGNRFGRGFQTGHHVLIRTGNTLGENVKVGSYASVEGGVDLEDCVSFGARSQAGSVFPDPAMRVRVGKGTTVYFGCRVTDRRQPPDGPWALPEIGENTVICANVIVIGGARIGDHSLIAAGAIVDKDVPDGMFLKRSGEIVPCRPR